MDQVLAVALDLFAVCDGTDGHAAQQQRVFDRRVLQPARIFLGADRPLKALLIGQERVFVQKMRAEHDLIIQVQMDHHAVLFVKAQPIFDVIVLHVGLGVGVDEIQPAQQRAHFFAVVAVHEHVDIAQTVEAVDVVAVPFPVQVADAGVL